MTVFIYNCRFRIQCVYLFRSQANGSCLFLIFSIAMYGNNRYVDDSRILTVIELYLKSDSHLPKKVVLFASLKAL